MSKTVSDYFAIWQLAHLLFERYANDLDNKNLADEQYIIRQHAMNRLANIPANSTEEIRMKLRVAAYESGANLKQAPNGSLSEKLKCQVIKELDRMLEAQK